MSESERVSERGGGRRGDTNIRVPLCLLENRGGLLGSTAHSVHHLIDHELLAQYLRVDVASGHVSAVPPSLSP